MYSENKTFCFIFQTNFTEDISKQIFPKEKSVQIWKLWINCYNNVEKFFNEINFYNKMKIYNWFMLNIVKFVIEAKIRIPNITSFLLTKPLCYEIFPECSEYLWSIWLNNANEDPEKFISIINIKYKLCLTLWNSDVNNDLS